MYLSIICIRICITMRRTRHGKPDATDTFDDVHSVVYKCIN